jgi:hydrogenase maturation factor
MLSSGALLFTTGKKHRQAVLDVAAESGIPVARIGRMIPAHRGIIELNDTVRSPLPRYDRDEITRVL